MARHKCYWSAIGLPCPFSERVSEETEDQARLPELDPPEKEKEARGVPANPLPPWFELLETVDKVLAAAIAFRLVSAVGKAGLARKAIDFGREVTPRAPRPEDGGSRRVPRRTESPVRAGGGRKGGAFQYWDEFGFKRHLRRVNSFVNFRPPGGIA